MKCAGKITVCLASVLALVAGARADDIAMSGNPYIPIVTRNVFGLNPPPTNVLTVNENDQVPKITLKGIMSIMGQAQALFNIPPKPGLPGAKETSYILSEGQQQDEIEVLHINEKAGMVTFNNHGVTQEVPLANAPTSGAPGSPGAGPGGPGGGGFPIPPRFGGARPGGGPGGRFGGLNRGVASGGGGMDNNNANNANNVAPQMGGGASSQIYQPQQNAISPEEQTIMIEAQRAQWEKQGNSAASILPPTALTPLLKGGVGNNQLAPH
jgi:hypothetical protein